MGSFATRRAFTTLVGAAAAGALLWLAGAIARHTNVRYWESLALVAAAGVVFAVSQLRGREGHPPLHLGVLFVPVLVVAGWVLVALQPDPNGARSHVLTWSSHLGILDAVAHVGMWTGVLAFAIGYTLGLALEPRPRPQPVSEEPQWPHARGREPVLEAPEVEEETYVGTPSGGSSPGSVTGVRHENRSQT